MIAHTTRPIAILVLWISFNDALCAAQILMTASFGGHLYHLVGGSGTVGTGINYTDASAYAAQLGGFLVTVDNAAENLFLFNTFASASFPGFQPVDGLYLGFTDVAVEGSFAWDSGSPVTYTNWAAGEPNNTHGREDWGTMVGALAADAAHYGPTTWNDIPNIASTGEVGANPSAPFYAIVELVPEPGSLQLISCAMFLLAHKRVRSGHHPSHMNSI